MASIRRTLSPVPRPGSIPNAEAIQVSSPLSRSSSSGQNYPSHDSPLSSSLAPVDFAWYKAQNFFYGLVLQHPYRSFDRSKLKGQILVRSSFHFLMCFFIGIFLGLTPFVPLNLSDHVGLKQHHAFTFDMLHAPVEGKDGIPVVGSSRSENSTSQEHGRFNYWQQASDQAVHDLLIIVTPTHARARQSYYLSRLAHTLKLVSVPLLWIVVEMNSQSPETAELLRNTGVMYRHLACTDKNLTGSTSTNSRLRNVALSHIEKHSLNGIVYFADDSNTYSTELFDQMRKISRIGVWGVATLAESSDKVLLEGPACNGSQVVGWHLDDTTKAFQRFHAEMSGFAFNSTILWDPKKWRLSSVEPVRLLDEVPEDSQASRFMQQIVEDESQMECIRANSSAVMVWKQIPSQASASLPFP